MPIHAETIPAELKQRPQWVVWRYEERGGKRTKVPYCVATGALASTTDPQTWTAFEAAEVCQRRGKMDGVGYVFSADDPYVGVDLDQCRDPETGEIQPEARQWLALLDSYAEVTPSQAGIHVICRGRLPGSGRKGPGIEMYERGRYFTFTGDVLDPAPRPIRDCEFQLKLMYGTLFAPKERPQRPVPPVNGARPDDAALVDKVLKEGRYVALWRGDWGAYPSQSEADLALTGRIAFFAGPDPALIDVIFRQSGLYREKWDDPGYGSSGSTYGADTIQTALAGKSEFYDWHSRPRPARREAEAPPAAQGAADEGEADWESPVPLYAVSLPCFPLDALPPYVQAMVEGTARATQTPPDLAAMVALAVLATAAQKRVEAQVRPGWKEVLSLWTVTSLSPGNRKSPAYAPMVAPLQEFERCQIERMKNEIAEAKTEYEVMEGALKKLKEQAVKAKNSFDRDALTQQAVEIAQRLERMPVPKSPRMIADDATPEELGRLLLANGGRMAIISDEGDVFDMMAGKYSSGKANIGIYLRSHSGGDIIVDRVGRPDVVVRRAAITFGLCVQPESLLGLTSNPTFKGRGLIGRFLYAVPFSRLGDRAIRPEPLPPSVAEEYHQRMIRLLSLPAAEDEAGLPIPHFVLFSDEADDAVAAFEAWIEPLLSPGSELGYMSDWAGKLVGQTCRIATLLHLAELAEVPEPWKFPLDAETFLAARRIAEYLIPHAQAAFQAMGTNPAINRARLILLWLKKNGRALFQKRDLFNALRAHFDRATELDEPLVILLEHGFIRQIAAEKRVGPGQPPSPAFRVHPEVFH